MNDRCSAKIAFENLPGKSAGCIPDWILNLAKHLQKNEAAIERTLTSKLRISPQGTTAVRGLIKQLFAGILQTAVLEQKTLDMLKNSKYNKVAIALVYWLMLHSQLGGDKKPELLELEKCTNELLTIWPKAEGNKIDLLYLFLFRALLKLIKKMRTLSNFFCLVKTFSTEQKCGEELTSYYLKKQQYYKLQEIYAVQILLVV